MIKESELERKKSLDMDFDYLPRDEKEEIMKSIKEEEDMDAKELVNILEPYLKKSGFLTVREKNYLGSNECPFDLTAGDENTLAIYGFEIKSDKDTFERLDRQLYQYSFICEEVYIVLHKKEAPKWLPNWCGILRITKKGKIYREQSSYPHNLFDISTGYAWDKMAHENGIGLSKDKLKPLFDEILAIRRNILFNHYFAIEYDSTVNQSNFKKFFPLSDRQKRFIAGLTIDYQVKEIEREIKSLEKRFTIMKKVVNIGQEDLFAKQQKSFVLEDGGEKE